MDKITLSGLTFRTCHGVLNHEKIFPQTFIIDAELFLDLGAAISDELGDTINYAAAADYIESVVCGERFQLIERLALTLCEGLRSNFPIKGVRVTVKKPQAPLSQLCDYAAVTVERGELG